MQSFQWPAAPSSSAHGSCHCCRATEAARSSLHHSFRTESFQSRCPLVSTVTEQKREEQQTQRGLLCSYGAKSFQDTVLNTKPRVKSPPIAAITLEGTRGQGPC